MSKKLGIPFLVLLIVLSSAFTINNGRLYEISKNIEIFINVYKELNTNYVDDIDPTHLMRIGLDAMVGSLDPYTNYFSESQVQSYRISTDGKYEGIGAVVRKIDDYVTIVEPYQDSPVLEAGLKAGDQIIEIEGMSTKGKTQAEVTQIYRGVPGTKVNLTIQRPGQKELIYTELTRAQVDIPNVPYSGFVDPDVGYIALTTFTAGASKNIRSALRDLKNENTNLKGVILDLRNNGGGLLAEAVKISNIFIPKGKEVVSVKSKVRERDISYKTQDLPVDEELPLVVLINKNSASASEIVSGVMQDYDRGILMGQRSYGKGLVQNTKDVGYNSQVKLTTSKYYIPSGRCIQSVEYDEGEPVDIPDEQRAKFKTSKGRIVLDGGGVSPDLEIDELEQSEILTKLIQENIIFKYVTEYVSNMEPSEELEEITFDGYDDFLSYVNDSNFSFSTKSEELLQELEENLKSSDINAGQEEIKSLESIFENYMQNAILENKEEITDFIELQIATRQHFQKGKIFQRLKDDKELDEAIALLKDQSKYNLALVEK